MTFAISVAWICTSLYQIHSVCFSEKPNKTQKRSLFRVNEILVSISARPKCNLFTIAKYYDNDGHHFDYFYFLLLWQHGDVGMPFDIHIGIRNTMVSLSNAFAKAHYSHNATCAAAVLFQRIPNDHLLIAEFYKCKWTTITCNT